MPSHKHSFTLLTDNTISNVSTTFIPLVQIGLSRLVESPVPLRPKMSV